MDAACTAPAPTSCGRHLSSLLKDVAASHRDQMLPIGPKTLKPPILRKHFFPPELGGTDSATAL